MIKRHPELVVPCLLLASLVLAAPQADVASEATLKLLSYEQAFGSPPGPPRDDAPGEGGLLGRLPAIQGWLDDDHYLESRADPSGGQRRLYKVRATDGKASVHRDWVALAKLVGEGMDPKRPAAESPDGGRLVFAHDNDLYALDVAARTLRRLTATPAEERNPTFSPDGRWLAYTRGNDLYAYDLVAGLERQLTRDGSEVILNGVASWVYYEEILGRATAYRAFWWSPDSTRLAFLRFDDSPVPVFPIYQSAGQHGELERQRYPKAGDPNPLVRAAVVPVAGGAPVFMDFDPEADHYLAFPTWTPDSKTLIVQWMNRGQDTLRLFACEPETGAKRQIHEERQAAWVEFYADLRVLRDGRLLFTSDVDGWNHLTLLGADSTTATRLTQGEWRVDSIATVDETAGWVVFTGRPHKPWVAQLLRVRLDGTGLAELTAAEGVHRARVSPSGRYFIDTFSTIALPSRMRVHRGDGTLLRELGDQRTAEMDAYAWGKAELLTIPAADGTPLPASWVRPAELEPERRYPVIVSIYGGPGAASVHDAWPGLAAHYWAQRGVIFLRVDHRGSGHLGKKGMALMHRRLGVIEMEDYGAAATWLRAQPFVATDRIGITGGSYGGYVTLMAMTKGTPHFNFGQASASVSDWQLYDSVYTERYMDAPAENREGYAEGAVLTHIERYQGGLRLTHGTADDNVHLQNSLQVIDWLVSHDKPFELMLYPGSRHGIRGPQRRHDTRETHDFWVRTLLDGAVERAPFLPAAPPSAAARPH